MIENKQIAEMLQACPYNDGEFCNYGDYHADACDGKCEIAEALKNYIKKEPPPVKAIFEDINEALSAEVYKANKHKYNPTEEAQQRGARAALNNVFSIIAEIEKKHTEREGTDNDATK